jgi:uncharacterized membrane protein YccF (DUF307 family)
MPKMARAPWWAWTWPALAFAVMIPFAWAHVKLAGLALWPIGKMIVPA